MKIQENVSLLERKCDLRIVREEMDELRCMLYSEYQHWDSLTSANDQSMEERMFSILDHS
jgi:hypothetical protein